MIAAIDLYFSDPTIPSTNPYKTASTAIVTTTLTACNTTTEGQTSVNDDGTTVTVKSCTANKETLLSGTVTIE